MYNKYNISLIDMTDVLTFATKKHEGQIRWCGEPYITHPMAVSNNALYYVKYYGPVINIVALLHDVIEDCYDDFDVGYAVISAKFGKFVADAVMILTHRPDMGYSEYIDNICDSGNVISMIVKICDIGHNLSSCYTDRTKNRKRIIRYERSREQILNRYHNTDKTKWMITECN